MENPFNNTNPFFEDLDSDSVNEVVETYGSLNSVLKFLLEYLSPKYSVVERNRAMVNIGKLASNNFLTEGFKLLFDDEKTCGGFSEFSFFIHENYETPVASEVELDADAQCYEKEELFNIIEPCFKVSTTLACIQHIENNPNIKYKIKHILPANNNNNVRCNSLWEVVSCVWFRTCHLWGNFTNPDIFTEPEYEDYDEFHNNNNNNYEDEENTFFKVSSLDCLKLDGSGNAPYIWLNVTNSGTEVNIKEHTIEDMHIFRIRYHGSNKWICFDMESKSVTMSSIKNNTQQDITILLCANQEEEEDFRVMVGMKKQNNYFLLITVDDCNFYGFYKKEGSRLAKYPIFIHQNIRPSVFPNKTELCSICNKEIYISDEDSQDPHPVASKMRQKEKEEERKPTFCSDRCRNIYQLNKQDI